MEDVVDTNYPPSLSLLSIERLQQVLCRREQFAGVWVVWIVVGRTQDNVENSKRVMSIGNSPIIQDASFSAGPWEPIPPAQKGGGTRGGNGHDPNVFITIQLRSTTF
jgi:hypothetical protein